jgi:hypothetical protein
MARLHAYRANRRGVELLLNKPAFAKFPSITGAIWAVLGDHDRAEEQFTRALERKDLNLPYLLAEPEPRLDNNRWLRTQAAALGIRRA